MEHKQINEKESGQSLIEFAFSFVIIVLLIVGAVELGRLYFSYIAIYDAAQEGALFGAHYPGDTTAIKNHVRGTSSNPIDLTDTGLVDVQVNHFDAHADTAYPCAGDGLEVEVRYTFDFTMPLIGAFIPSNQIPLTASVISTVLSPACN
jgi:Flp pilus assembly protein TadG